MMESASFKEYREYYNLGNYERQITTSSPESRSWFNYGLIWSYAFNHEESEFCFLQAIAADPECAIAYWGLAYALGPNYNKPWEAFDQDELGSVVRRTHDAVTKARDYSKLASGVEIALIKALGYRYPDTKAQDSKGFCIWNEEYANAMGSVYQKYPDDLDVATLYADSLMNLTPWGLWDLRTGEPPERANFRNFGHFKQFILLLAQDSLTQVIRTLQIKAVLEKAIAQPHGMEHPGLLHLYIHLVEMSSTPETGMTVSRQLQSLVPDGGHLNHMPSHIYILCGDYQEAIKSNTAATIVDRKFLARSGNLNFYSLYRCHDSHFLIYAAMFAGQKEIALKAMDDILPSISTELLRVQSPPMADWLESFHTIRVHILIRFGLWNELLALDLPTDQDLYCVTTAMLHYGKGIAHAALGDVKSATIERANFNTTLERVKPSRTLFNNKCTDILAIAKEMLNGEIEYRNDNFEVAFAHLRNAIELEDNLPYDEPWGWMQPTRHALGALSLEQGKVEEAAAIYRADLGLDDTLPRSQRHPNNVWALHGYHECLVKLGRTAEAEEVKIKMDKALEGVDVPIVSSCFCRLKVAGDVEHKKCCD